MTKQRVGTANKTCDAEGGITGLEGQLAVAVVEHAAGHKSWGAMRGNNLELGVISRVGTCRGRRLRVEKKIWQLVTSVPGFAGNVLVQSW